jgi:hypothetical protein
MTLTAFEQFILEMDAAMKNGARDEQALRAYITEMAKKIKQREKD